MILYSVCTTYHLLEAMVHKCNYRKNDEAIILITTWIKDKYAWYENLTALFKKVVVFDGHYEVKENTEQNLQEYFSKLFRDESIDINDFSEINVYGAEHSFGAYVSLSNIPYKFWEEGAGALGKGEEMRAHFLKP